MSVLLFLSRQQLSSFDDAFELFFGRDDARDAHEDDDGLGDREIRAGATKHDDAMRGDASRCV